MLHKSTSVSGHYSVLEFLESTRNLGKCIQGELAIGGRALPKRAGDCRVRNYQSNRCLVEGGRFKKDKWGNLPRDCVDDGKKKMRHVPPSRCSAPSFVPRFGPPITASYCSDSTLDVVQEGLIENVYTQIATSKQHPEIHV